MFLGETQGLDVAIAVMEQLVIREQKREQAKREQAKTTTATTASISASSININDDDDDDDDNIGGWSSLDDIKSNLALMQIRHGDTAKAMDGMYEIIAIGITEGRPHLETMNNYAVMLMAKEQ